MRLRRRGTARPAGLRSMRSKPPCAQWEAIERADRSSCSLDHAGRMQRAALRHSIPTIPDEFSTRHAAPSYTARAWPWEPLAAGRRHCPARDPGAGDELSPAAPGALDPAALASASVTSTPRIALPCWRRGALGVPAPSSRRAGRERSPPLPKYISSGVWPLKAWWGITLLCCST
jgi:hypothetical protein